MNKSVLNVAVAILFSLGVTACSTGSSEKPGEDARTVALRTQSIQNQEKIKELEAQKTELNGKVATLEKQKAELEQKVSSLTTNLENSKTELATLQNKLAETAANNNAATNQEVSNLQKQIADKTAEIAALNSQIANQTAELAEKTAQAQKQAEEVLTLKRQVVELASDAETKAKAEAEAKAAEDAANKAKVEAEAARKAAEEQAQAEKLAKEAAEAEAKAAEEAKKAAEAKAAEEAANKAKEEAEEKAAQEAAAQLAAQKAQTEARFARYANSTFAKDENSRIYKAMVSEDAYKALVAEAKSKVDFPAACTARNGCGKTEAAGTVLASQKTSSYAGYAVLRDEYLENKPINAFFIYNERPTTDKAQIVNATYKGKVSYSRQFLPNVNTNENLVLNVTDMQISGKVTNTTGSGVVNDVITFNTANIDANSDGAMAFNGSVTFHAKRFGNAENLSGSYKGEFAGDNAEHVIGTFESKGTDKASSIQGAFSATK